MVKISSLPADASPTSTDYAVLVDSESGQTKKVLLSTLFQTIIPSGGAVQQVSTLSSAVQTGVTVIPADDTIPQITEGNEYMTLAITPKSATNILVIQVITYISSSISTQLTTALFQDTTANALAVGETYQGSATGAVTIPLLYSMVAGSTSPTTFRLRAGGGGAGTTTFNGDSGGRKYGATTKSSIMITEYEA